MPKRPLETDVEVRAVPCGLDSSDSRATAGAIGLRQGAEQGASGQARNLAEEDVAGSLGIRNRHNRL